eukprot:5524242-Prymnesium_polylepis.1
MLLDALGPGSVHCSNPICSRQYSVRVRVRWRSYGGTQSPGETADTVYRDTAAIQQECSNTVDTATEA